MRKVNFDKPETGILQWKIKVNDKPETGILHENSLECCCKCVVSEGVRQSHWKFEISFKSKIISEISKCLQWFPTNCYFSMVFIPI